MFRLLVAIGLLLVLALAAALFAPPFVDWNQYRARFEAEASRLVGRPVTVRGSTSVRLLPLPSVTFSDVEVGGGEGDGPLVVAGGFSMDIELPPLLRGEVRVVRMEIDRPRLELRLDESGRIVWPARNGAPSRVTLEDEEVSFEAVTVTDGIVRLTDARNGNEIVVADIDMQARGRALQGPWRGEGTARAAGDRFRFDGGTGRWNPDEGRMRLAFGLAAQSSPYDLSFEGGIVAKDGVPSASGKLRVAPMGAQTDGDRIAFPRPAPPPDRPRAVAEADITFDGRALTLPAIEILLGQADDPYRLTGEGRLDLSDEATFLMSLEGQQIDLAALERAAREESGNDGQGVALIERVSLLFRYLDRLPAPPVRGRIAVDLPAIVTGDTVLREVSATLQRDDDWSVSGLSAELPGRTSLRAEGLLGRDKAGLTYQGPLTLLTRQPSGLAKWLGAEPDATIRDLDTAGFTAQVDLTDRSIRATEIELRLDASRLTGALSRVPAAAGVPPRLETRLAGDTLDLDQLLALARMLGGQAVSAALGDHTVSIELDTAGLRWNGFETKAVEASLVADRDALVISRLSVTDLDGIDLTLGARLAEDGSRLTGDGTGSVSGRDPGGLLARLNRRFGPFPGLGQLAALPLLTEGADLAFSFEDDGTAFAMRAEGTLANVRSDLVLSGRAGGRLARAGPFEAKIVLDADDATDLFAGAGLDVVPGTRPGRGALRLSLWGGPDDGFELEGALTTGAGFATATGRVAPSVAAEKILLETDLAVAVDLENVDPFLTLFALAVPGVGSGASAAVEGRLVSEAGRYDLSEFEGTIAGTTVSGTLGLDATAQPRPVLSGRMTAGSVAAQWLRDLVHGEGGAVLRGLDGSAEMSLETLALSDTAGAIQPFGATVTMVDGDMTFDAIDGRIADGRLTGRLTLARAGRSRLLDAALRLDEASLGALGSSLGLDLPVAGTGTLDVRVEGASDQPDALGEALTGGGTLSVREGHLAGIDPNGFSVVLARADTIADDRLDASGPDLAAAILNEARFPLDGLSIAFTLGSGTARAANVALSRDGATLDGDIRLSLTQRRLEADGTLTFDAGVEAVTGVAPRVRLQVGVTPDGASVERDLRELTTYLGMRASERRARLFEGQRAAILERQRLAQAARLYQLREAAARLAAEEKARLERLAREQEAARKRAEERRRREEIERARVRARLLEAERRAEREAAEEAGRRARRAQEIDELRRRAEEAAERLFRGALPEQEVEPTQ